MINLNALVCYLKRHLSTDVFELLMANGVAATGPTGLRRWVAERDVEAFAKLYFPDEFTLDLAPIHKLFVSDISDIRTRQITRQAGLKVARAIPRGHSKTTWYGRIMPLHALLYGWSALTVLLGNTQSSAERLLANIRNLAETNDAIREDFPAIQGGVWQSARIETTTGNTIVCFGVGNGAVRGVSKPGKRPSLIIADDLDDDASVRSPVQLEANTEWWDKAILALGDNVSFTTSFVVTGTLIRKTSLMQHILDSADFHSTVEQGVKRFSARQDLWSEWQDWYLAEAAAGNAPKDADSDTFYQSHKDHMLAGTQVLWERPDGYYSLMLYRLARGTAAFESEIQNQPGESGGALGKMQKVALPTNLQEWQLLASLDPTIKGAKTNDRAAWVEVLFNRRERKLVVSYVNAEQRSYAKTINDVVKRMKDSTKHYDGLWIESNAHGEPIADQLDTRIKQAGLFYEVIRVNNNLPKDVRINSLAEYIERGQLVAADSIDPEFFNELEGYPGYRFDDILDALATIVLQMRNARHLDFIQSPF